MDMDIEENKIQRDLGLLLHLGSKHIFGAFFRKIIFFSRYVYHTYFFSFQFSVVYWLYIYIVID